MKIFADTADVADIRRLASMGLVDGVTTNPSLVAKTGRDYADVVKEICALVDGPISAEVIATEAGAMIVATPAKIHAASAPANDRSSSNTATIAASSSRKTTPS